MRLKSILLLLCLTTTVAWANNTVISRIGFGSCAKEDRPQPIWNHVNASNPDLFLLIGDNIYGDTKDMDVMRKKYAQFDSIPEFAQLRKTVPVLGTWDDHDYGQNDAGNGYPMKKESQQVFLDFFRVPKDSPRREQEGVYHSEIFGPEGKRVQVILLDTRYFRSPLKSADNSGKPYVANDDPRATILGKKQWSWFEEQLRKPAELRLVVSSIQVVSEDHGSEKWMNFPSERERLFQLIAKTKAAGIVFLSGDRHFAEISMMNAKVGYPIYDFTSSGLNQAAKQWRPFQTNHHRVAGMNFDDNFGLITIDWEKADPILSLQVHDVEGDLRINQKLPLSVLQFGTLK
ncbi:MAG: alkaline phosphatase family protein [Verrucomicrobia bacterium]|nr:alkaline phosphatase family protein [Verrucomicrobiota bacterium]